VAVTGHRRLADEQAVRKAIEDGLDQILAIVPAPLQAECRLVAVSALAEGADRLVAEAVLARPGGRLEVILPMPAVRYVTDFGSACSVPEFERLLAAASWVMTLPSLPAREDSYVAAGKAVVDRADVTIAIWDGREAAGTGGTAEIVSYLKHEDRPWLLLPANGGPPAAGNLEQLTKADWLARLTDSEPSRLGDFNAAPLDAGEFSKALGDFSKALTEAAGGGALAVEVDKLLGWVQAPYARAELVSMHFQKLYLRLTSALFALSALAVCTVGLQLIYFPQVHLIVTGEVACLLTIIGGLRWGRHKHVHQRWISTRYLAERLRNALFLALAGVGERPSAASPVIDEDPAAPWVRTAFRMVWITRPQLDPGSVSLVSLRPFLVDAWIEDQRQWFDRASKHGLRQHHISALVVEGLFALSVVLAIIHVLLGGPENWIHHLISLLAIGIPACAASLVGHNTEREYLRHALRYRRMAYLLADASARMRAATNRARVQRVAVTVERAMRQERGDWFGTVSLHDLEVPA
jgi:hypothetical protein